MSHKKIEILHKNFREFRFSYLKQENWNSLKSLMTTCWMTACEMIVCQMTVWLMNICWMTVWQMTVWWMTVWLMTICRMTIWQMTIDCQILLKFFEMTNVFVISARGHVTGLLRYVYLALRLFFWFWRKCTSFRHKKQTL